MDKVTLDFENGTIEWNTDGQKGTEVYPELKSHRKAILAVLGYDEFDVSDIVSSVNAFANGSISMDELKGRLQEESDSSGGEDTAD